MSLSENPMFNQINPNTLATLEQAVVEKTLTKGHILFDQDSPADFAYLINKGWVKLYRETLDGEEAIIDVINDGHMFGETAIFDNNHYDYGAQIIEDTSVLIIPLPLLRTHIEEDKGLAINMLNAMSKYRKQQRIEKEHLTLQNASQRIGCFILRLCTPTTQFPTIFHLPYDKTLIASRLGMKPETFSRALVRLQEDTNIKIQGSSVSIDNVDQLSNYSCNACSSSFPCSNLY